MPRLFRLTIALLVVLLVGVAALATAALAFGATPAIIWSQPEDGDPNPLPHDCDGVAAFGDTVPACCAFGYVYHDGQPAANAQVVIASASGVFTTTTEAGSISADPYFLSALSASPLSVAPGQWITVTATVSGATSSTAYQVTAGGQQVDVVIPSRDGDRPPIATINYIHPDPPRPGLDTATLYGSGADADASGAGVTAWQWSSDLAGPLSGQRAFSVAVASLLTGTHAVSLQVQDDEGNWSAAATRPAQILGYDLLPGWNMVVVPSRVYDAARLLEEIVAQGGCPLEMDRWVESLGNWSGFIPGLPFGNFTISPARPYFVKLSCPSSLRLLASAPAVQSGDLVLVAGWSFVALPPCAPVMTAEAACQQIKDQGGDAVEIARWEAAVGNWASHPCGTPIGNFDLSTDEGYFIRSNVESVWRVCSAGNS